MKDTDIAYAAGILDGEGTITLSKPHSSDRFRAPVVSVSSTTYELLDFMKTAFGGHISSHKTYKEHHKPSWSWKVSYDKALTFLEQVTPYLREPEKARRATLLLSSYKQTTKRNGKYSDTDIAAKLLFESEFFHPSTA